MDYSYKFLQIKKIKSSRDPRYRSASINYCTKVLEKVIKNKQVYLPINFNKIAKDTQGVYLIYSLDEDKKIKVSYIGESTDIHSRWKQHIYNFNNKARASAKIRRFEKSAANLRFVILTKTTDQNQRLKAETYYIYTFKSKFCNANASLANRKMRCDFGHGVKRTFLGYEEVDDKLQLLIYGVCWNKMCKQKFLINKPTK